MSRSDTTKYKNRIALGQLEHCVYASGVGSDRPVRSLRTFANSKPWPNHGLVNPAAGGRD